MSRGRRVLVALAVVLAAQGVFSYFWPRDLLDLIVDNRTDKTIRVTCVGTGLNLTVAAHSEASGRIYRGSYGYIEGELVAIGRPKRRIPPTAMLLESRWTATEYARQVRVVFE